MNLRKRKIDQKDEKGSVAQQPSSKQQQPDKKAEAASWRIEQFLTDLEWKEALKDEFERDYFKELNKVLGASYAKNLARPPKEKVFNAFNSTKLSEVRGH